MQVIEYIMFRLQKAKIIEDLKQKMVFVVGPRQVGKTTLALDIAKSFANPQYLNYDQIAGRQIIEKQSWLVKTDLLILDEIHKMPNWKKYLKGIYDAKPSTLQIIVTGSARLDTYKNMGESLAGRFFVHHLMPFSLFEIKATKAPQSLEDLLIRGGFPEPLFAENEDAANRWRYQYVNSMVREDILDFAKIGDIKVMGYLFELLRDRVASPISYTALAEDLKIAPNTVIKYIEILEALYIVFRITPFSKNIVRAIQKAPKLYFYDTGLVNGDDGKKLENLAANSLWQYCYFKRDYLGQNFVLQYLRDKEGRESDFAISCNNSIEDLIEIKYSENNIDKNLKYFSEKYNLTAKQLVLNIKQEYQDKNIEVLSLEKFLQELLVGII
jgi:uncharacterized protein